VRIPRILLAVPLVAAGLLLPALTDPPDTPPEVVIGMAHEGFVMPEASEDSVNVGDVPVITINTGETLTFQNNSRWIHILGPGRHGLLASPGSGAMTPRHMLEENETYTTAPWDNPGTYPITCPVHPDMNAEVVVLP
jgi:plastocyanin